MASRSGPTSSTGAKEKLGIAPEPFFELRPTCFDRLAQDRRPRQSSAPQDLGESLFGTLPWPKTAAPSSTAASPGERPAELAKALAAYKKALLDEPAAHRDAQVVRARASRPSVPCHAGIPRRLGRSHRLEQHQDEAGGRLLGEEPRQGRYIHYGIREHGMAAAMNGIALHGGFVP